MITHSLHDYRSIRARQVFSRAGGFRIVRKLTVVAGTPVVWKVACPVDFILLEQTLAASVGDIEFYAWTADNVAPGGTFGTPVPIVGKNRSGEHREYDGARYTAQMTTMTGGSVAPIDANSYVDYDRAKTSNATAQQTSVGGAPNSERYLPAGTYYLEFRSLDGTSVGRYALAWEERPDPAKP